MIWNIWENRRFRLLGHVRNWYSNKVREYTSYGMDRRMSFSRHCWIDLSKIVRWTFQELNIYRLIVSFNMLSIYHISTPRYGVRKFCQLMLCQLKVAIYRRTRRTFNHGYVYKNICGIFSIYILKAVQVNILLDKMSKNNCYWHERDDLKMVASLRWFMKWNTQLFSKLRSSLFPLFCRLNLMKIHVSNSTKTSFAVSIAEQDLFGLMCTNTSNKLTTKVWLFVNLLFILIWFYRL